MNAERYPERQTVTSPNPLPSANPANLSAPVEWYKEPWVWLLWAIPGSAVLMGAIMLTLAITSFDGLVKDDYYKQGMRINLELGKDKMAASMGIRMQLRFDPQRQTIEASSLGGTNISVPDLHLELSYATRAGLDKNVLLSRNPDGKFVGTLTPLRPGYWYLRIGADSWHLRGGLYGPLKGVTTVVVEPLPKT